MTYLEARLRWPSMPDHDLWERDWWLLTAQTWYRSIHDYHI